MPASEDIFVKIGGSAKDLMVAINSGITGLNKLRANVNKFALTGASNFSSLTKSVFSLQNILAGSAAGAAVGWGVKLAAEAQQSKIAFEVMLGSGRKATQMLGELKQFANVSPFSQVEVREAAKLLLNYGVAGEKVLPLMKQLGDISAGDGVKLEALSRAFGQMSATGRLMGQDLNQMINAGFNPLQEISARTGESMLMLKARMEAGQVGIGEVEQALKDATSEGGRFFGMTEKQSKSTAGLFSSAMDVMESSATAFGEMLIKTFSIDELLTSFNEQCGSAGDVIESLGPIAEMYHDIFVGAFKDMQSVMGNFTTEAGGMVGILGFAADVAASLGKVGYAAFHGIQYIAGGALGTIAAIIKAWTWFTSLLSEKPDYAFADALIAERDKLVKAAGDGFASVIDTALPSEEIKRRMALIDETKGKIASLEQKVIDLNQIKKTGSPIEAAKATEEINKTIKEIGKLEDSMKFLRKEIPPQKAKIDTGDSYKEIKKFHDELAELNEVKVNPKVGKPIDPIPNPQLEAVKDRIAQVNSALGKVPKDVKTTVSVKTEHLDEVKDSRPLDMMLKPQEIVQKQAQLKTLRAELEAMGNAHSDDPKFLTDLRHKTEQAALLQKQLTGVGTVPVMDPLAKVLTTADIQAKQEEIGKLQTTIKAFTSSHGDDPAFASQLVGMITQVQTLSGELATAGKPIPDPLANIITADDRKRMEQYFDQLTAKQKELEKTGANTGKVNPGEDKAAKVIAELMAEKDVLTDATHAKERYKLSQMGVSEANLDMIDTMRAENMALKEVKSLQEQLSAVGEGSHGKERFRLAQAGVNAESLEYIDTLRKELDAKKELEKENKKLEAKSKTLKENILTPLEKSKKEFEDLQKMFGKGLITGDEFNKAAKKLDVDTMKEKGEKAHKQFGGFTLANSQEAREQILNFKNPQINKTDYAKQSVDIQKQLLIEAQKSNRREPPPEDWDTA